MVIGAVKGLRTTIVDKHSKPFSRKSSSDTWASETLMRQAMQVQRTWLIFENKNLIFDNLNISEFPPKQKPVLDYSIYIIISL